MGKRIGPSFNTGATLNDIAEFWRQVSCDKCHAPPRLPCLDHRSYDKFLYGVRVHPTRRRAVAALVAAKSHP